MNLPESVRIGYADYVVEDWNGVDALRDDKSGDYDHEHLHIRVSDAMKPPVRACVFLHEVVHGIVTHQSVPCGDYEEDVVTKITERLCQVMRSNPGLFAEIESALERKGN